MERRIALAAMLSLAVGFSNSRAKAENADSPPLPVLLHWGRYEVQLGRLRLASTRFNQTKVLSVVSEDRSRRETYSVNVNHARMSSHYESQTPQRLLKVAFEANGTVSILVEPSGVEQPGFTTAVAMEFTQQPSGAIEMHVGEGADRRSYQAPCFWRMMLAEPTVCRQHLTPVLEGMRPDWGLNETASGIEAELIRVAPNPSGINRERVRQLVGRLSHESFGLRQEAQNELVGYGQGVLPWLDEINPDLLDREQLHRVASIRKAFACSIGDSPARAVALLENDKQTWIVLLSHDDLDCRRLAAGRLSRMWGRPFTFDPTASPDERIAQIETISRTMLR
ncbi:hypothetical protein [Lignipirellula cremea]|uniref:Uncharacterized protein n=1 Tax=Lignipirellula cremea TaxID=2528010 RepID=A0A518DU81_9BACT|nr:hypothetical protein [Lignipirellula cremea]QDU95393.1 hypothetical protein Pla8534_32080 [Lignipirellula cremea]